MHITNLTQGTPEWLAHRARHFNASDAPAMLGVSSYKTRTELLRELHTGIPKEVDPITQRLFDDGHRFEALARPLAEQIIGDDLYPVVGTLGRLSASFDGLTIDEGIAYEHKTLNETLQAVMFDDDRADGLLTPVVLPMEYQVQMQQQCMVSGAERVLFMASKWDEFDQLIEERHCWYDSSPELADVITAGWAQFERDLADFQPEPVAVKPVGKAPDHLPALHIEVTGMVTASNLDAFREHALAVFAGINRDLTTDGDFADAEKTVKWLGDAETRLKAAKDHALAQTESIEVLFRAIDDISAEARRVRLELDKLIKARKEAIRSEIVAGGVTALKSHVASLNERIGRPLMPLVPADFAGAIKGKRTLESLKNAVSEELARAKIEASQIADRISINLAALQERADMAHLFPDASAIVLKATDDLRATMTARIADHQAKEADRLEAERERIRQEEAARAAREAARDAIEKASEAPKPQPQICQPPSKPQQDGAMIKLGQIGERLGFTLTADFLAALGFAPAATEKAAKLYREADFPAICAALVAHINKVAELQPA
jgi:putative phage-type endonuclease